MTAAPSSNPSSESLKPRPVVRARAVAPARLVFVRVADLPDPPNGMAPDAMILGMKTIRHGKGFIAHYLMPLDDRLGPPDAMMLIPVDTDTPMTPADPALALVLELAPQAAAAPEVGQVVENANGRFLKVRESYKDAFSLGYVALDAGDIRRRQERGVTAVFTWRLSGPATPPEPTPAAVAQAPPPAPTVPPRKEVLPAVAVQALRPMTVRDVEDVAALMVARGLNHARSDAEQRLASLLSSPLALCVVAEVDDMVAGAAIGHFDGFHAHLSHIAVAPSADRRGLGRILVEAMAEAALARGALDLRADATLADAPFLSAVGFDVAATLRLHRRVE